MVRICSYFLSETGCRARNGCRFRHDAFKCPCGALLLYSCKNQHESGRKHRQFMQQIGVLSGAAAAEDEDDVTIVMPEEDKTEKCPWCHWIVFASDMDGHRAEHERQDRIRPMEEELAKAEEDKEDITVDTKEGIHFGVIEAGTAEEIKLNIRRIEGKGPGVRLVNCFMRSSLKKDGSTSPFTASGIGRRLNVTMKKPLSVNVVFGPSYDGYHEDTLELVFFVQSRGSQFIITRHVDGTAGSWEDHEELRPKRPYKKKKKYVPFAVNGPVFPSPRPPVWTGIKWVNIMPMFKPPQKLIREAFDPSEDTSRKAVKRLMPKVFNTETYGDWFKNLLYIEGEQSQRDRDMLYAQYDVQLEEEKYKYKLMVKGIADGRPSVLVGDYVYARRSGDFQLEDNALYTGRIHAITGNTLTLHFSNEFSSTDRTRYDIRFIVNRVPERRKHQALMGSYKPMRILFPDERHLHYGRVTLLEMETINVINQNVKENHEQLEAVTAICKQPPGSVPFIIFGPAGTGKTVTMVEAIRQVLLGNPRARILACAPSNIAADTLAEKLITLGESQLFRLNSLARPTDKLRSGLGSFSLINDNDIFAIPTKEELQKYRAIVSTCISAGVLWGIGLRKGHFTHIFIDESGQGQEPDIMVPFLSLADDTTNFILAGDHQQLGPAVNSRIAKAYGLEKSYLRRMMEREIYDVDYGRGLNVVKLLKNYRNHPSILEFSNKHFYKSELIPSGDPAITHSLENIDELPTKRFPVIFDGIIGRDQQEESSPSFFNIDEVTVVKKYCQRLTLNYRKKNLRKFLRTRSAFINELVTVGPEEIGVITPYHSQKCKIQKALYKEDRLKRIKVGTVDEFQGQERRVIILSTVRSTPNHVTLDMKRSLGFVASPLRLNVAMTRAQALLIVVGNPIVLSLDPLWRSFLNYVHEKGGWRGVPIKWNPEEPVNLSSYDDQYRKRAEATMEDTLTRLRATVCQNLEQYNIDFDAGDSGGEDADEEYLYSSQSVNRGEE